MTDQPKPGRTIRIDASLTGQPQSGDLPPARIYLFDRTGRLVDSQPVGKENTFPISDDQKYRVTIGPDLLAGKEAPPEDLSGLLAKASAISKDYIPQLKQDRLAFMIHPNIWQCWWQTCILVHGHVQKLLNPGSPNPQYATICQGIVQIFQVDLGCTLDRLASFNLVSFRDYLVALLRNEIKLIDLPPIVRVPHLPDPPPERLANALNQFSMADQVSPSRSLETATRMLKENFTAAAKASASMSSSNVSFSHAELATTLSALDGTALKNFVVAQKIALWPFLCALIPDYWFCWQELGEVPINSDGTFSAEVCFWCPSDFPDLYFEVIQNIGGIEREISDPPIACSTYYDYDGSQEVVITVEDPTAVACLPDPGRPIPGNDLYVWPTAIGNIDLRNLTDVEGNPMVVNPTTGLANGATPWGGTLSLQMVFDPRLKTQSSVRYYRWSYQFEGDPNFTAIAATVTHRYMTVTYSPLTIHLNPVVLGPQTIGSTTNLFAVPDPLPGDGWVDINDPYDRPFAYFDSTDNQLSPFTYTDALPRRSGLCTLLLEMFDSSGTLVPCGNLVAGAFKFVLPDLGNPTQYTSVLTPNNITAQGQLMFRVRIDNNDTVARLDGVTTPIGSADQCGMLHYQNGSDNVAVQYVATHPHNDLTWDLTMSRGLSGGVASTSGTTSSPSVPPPPDATFNNSASTLLGTCENAAFATNLGCHATATDGYGRQAQYDRYATIAFALLKQPLILLQQV